MYTCMIFTGYLSLLRRQIKFRGASAADHSARSGPGVKCLIP